MPISFSMIVLSSHLVFAVADQVPKFDIARSCKLDAAAAATISERQPIKKCADDEQQAQQQPASQWSSFPAQAEQGVAAWRPLATHQATLVC